MKLNRRSFLKNTAILGITGIAAAGLPGCASKQGVDSSLAEGQIGQAITADKVTGKWAFEIAPDPVADSDITETIEAEVVVVGAGTSGLVTANSALDAGLNVVLISGSSKPISRGGSNNAAYSKVMEAAGVPRQDTSVIRKEILADHNSVDQKKWYKYYNKSEEAMDYVIDIAQEAGLYVGLEQINQIKQDSLYFQPLGTHCFLESSDSNQAGMAQQLLVEVLAQRFVAKGGQLFYRNAGYQLVRGGVPNGTEDRVTAVIAKRLDDDVYVKYIGKKAVVLAAGDFSTDRDMMHKYCPEYADMITDEAYDTEVDYDKGTLTTGGIFKGDMHKAGLWVGAAWQKTLPVTPMIGPSSAGPVVHRCQNFFGLLVDRNGERFMDEYEGRALGPINQSLQAGSKSYAIWDADWVNHFVWYNQSYTYQMREETKRDPKDVLASWDTNAEKGVYYKADTLKELIEKAGLPESTIDEIDRYNKMCEAKLDTEFYKDPDFLIPVKTGPFYCQIGDYTKPSFYTTLGGLRTNSNMQVCDKDDNAIPGLYNVGSMTGDFYAGLYTFMIAGLNYGSTCITFGYLTGKYIAKNE